MNDMDKGVGSYKKMDVGVGGKKPAGNDGNPGNVPAGNPGGNVRTGSRSSKSAKDGKNDPDEDEKKRTQAQLKNQGDIYQKRANDIGNQGKQQLKNIQRQMGANDSLYAQQKRQINTNVAWQPNQQKEQAALMAMRNRMGNAAYGSGIQDLAEGLQRVDDMNDVELINAYKQNMDEASDNWYQANSALVSDYNEAVTGINDEYSKLYSQYAAAMSNIDPTLATKSNLAKAAKAKKNAKANKEALYVAKSTKKAVDALFKGGKPVKKTFQADLEAGRGTPAMAQALKLLKKYQSDKSLKGDKKAIEKAVRKAAEKQVKKAQKRSTVSNEDYTLPNVNLSPGKKLQGMMKMKSPGQATSMDYIRPAKAADVGGTVNTSRVANTGFSDNLAAFRRV